MATSSRSADGSAWTPVFVAVAVAWLGLFVHNAVEFPHMPLSRPEYSAPTALWLVLTVIWWGLRRHEWPAKVLFAWGAISLAGAITTVLPLPFLPFRPEQSLRHYGVHLIYALTQLPILSILWPRRQSRAAEDY